MIEILSGWRGVTAAIILAAVAGWVTNGWRLNTKISDIKKDYAEQLATAQAQARIIEQRRWKERETIMEQTDDQIKKLEGIIASERATSSRLRDQVADYVQRARNSALAKPSESIEGRDSLGVLAQLLTRIDEAASEGAGYADRLREAGMSCERLYDSLGGQ